MSSQLPAGFLPACVDAGARCAAGGAAFFACVATTQALQGALRISTGTPLGIPSAVGLAAVCGASMAAVGAAETASRWLSTRDVRSSAASARALAQGPEGEKAAAGVAAFGALMFKALGGSFHGLAPSRLDRLGAFARPKFSLSATTSYATSLEKAAISKLGEVFGCHSCGTTRGPFHGDHMPPIKIVTEANARLWRRLLRARMSQRFYPQCKACSDLQSSAVRNRTGAFVHHFKALRPYHATGVVLVLATLLLANFHERRIQNARRRR